jgi:hypothetical protein
MKAVYCTFRPLSSDIFRSGPPSGIVRHGKGIDPSENGS